MGRNPFTSFAIAFCVGGLSLVSQVVGLRIGIQELGATPLAIASVLATALLGLSLGSYAFGKLADRVQSAWTFALLLLAGASIGVATVGLSGRAYAAWLFSLQLPGWLETASFAALALFPVHVLLGGVIPSLAKKVGDPASRRFQSIFSGIYAFEALGAATASMSFALVLLPSYGLVRSSVGASLLVLTTVFLLALLCRESTEPAADRADDERASDLPVTDSSAPVSAWLLLSVVFCGSVASLGMELIWQRYFAIVFGSDTHSYAVVASVFLIGLSLGGWLSPRRFDAARNATRVYAILIVLIATSYAVSLLILMQGFQLESMQRSLKWITEYPLLTRIGLAASVVGIPSVLIGMAFPMVVRIWAGAYRVSGTGSATGQIYGLVIFGNLIGVTLSGVWLIPAFGLKIRCSFFRSRWRYLASFCGLPAAPANHVGRSDFRACRS